MSLLLPGARSPLRDLFEVTDLAEPCKLPSFALALRSARKAIEGDKAIAGVNAIAIKADGDIVLFHVGKRGAHRTLWTFGTLEGNVGVAISAELAATRARFKARHGLPLSDVIGATS